MIQLARCVQQRTARERAAYAEPVDVPGASYAPTTSADGSDMAVSEVGTVLIKGRPPQIGSYDRFIIGGKPYDIEGTVADWMQGPFGYRPGVLYTVKRGNG